MRLEEEMVRSMPISETREKLTSLHQDLESTHDTIAVTRQGKKILALMSWEQYEAITETLSIMGDPKVMKKLKQSIKEMRAGRLIPLEEVEKEMG